MDATHARCYFRGDFAEYTGWKDVLYGRTFYEVKVLEGHQKGQTKWVVRPPDSPRNPSRPPA